MSDQGYGTDDRLIGQFDGQDPYLQYQPAFAYTLPIQLFVNGITITLLLVLFMHLACEYMNRRTLGKKVRGAS
jgi:hypothetical protein